MTYEIKHKQFIISYVKNEERISQRKRGWYLREKAKKLDLEKLHFNGTASYRNFITNDKCEICIIK